VIIDDASTINGDAKTSGMSITVPLKTWFKLGVELYSDGTVDGFKAKIYIDGVCRFISSNFYGAHSAGTMPQRGFSSVQFYTMRNPASSLLIDNIHTDVLTGKTFDDSDLGVGPSVGEDESKKNYDFDSSIAGATVLQNYPGSQNEIVADPTGKGHGNVLKVTKSNTDTGLTDDYRFDAPTKKGSDKLVFSMDLYIDKLSFADTSYMAMYQITVGNLSNPTYMMTIMYNNSTGKLYLGDASSTGEGNANTFDGAVIELDRWYNIKVVVDISGKADSFSATLYLDGVAVGESKNFYGSHNASASPTGDFKYVNIRVQRRVTYEAYLDNVVIDFE
jgi:hypothetical protein